MERLDKWLVDRGLADTRTQARRMIDTGRVSRYYAGRWQPERKAGLKVPPEARVRVTPDEVDRYVSRGALKLRGALDSAGIDPAQRVALDVGQSTGGFTDCLLQAGAARVVGVDVGRDQLAPALRADPRVTCLEGVNARDLPRQALLQQAPGGFELIVMDVSFISQTLILPGLPPLLAPGGQLVSLVKPQFEVGRAGIGKGGIVRDDRQYRVVEQRVRACCAELGLSVSAYFDSPISGGDGNREFFMIAGYIGD